MHIVTSFTEQIKNKILERLSFIKMFEYVIWVCFLLCKKNSLGMDTYWTANLVGLVSIIYSDNFVSLPFFDDVLVALPTSILSWVMSGNAVIHFWKEKITLLTERQFQNEKKWNGKHNWDLQETPLKDFNCAKN